MQIQTPPSGHSTLVGLAVAGSPMYLPRPDAVFFHAGAVVRYKLLANMHIHMGLFLLTFEKEDPRVIFLEKGGFLK